MVKLWHIFGYTTDRYHSKQFISKIVAAIDTKEAIHSLMDGCHITTFQTISIDEIELETGMIFDLE